jgi:hypothetical protein
VFAACQRQWKRGDVHIWRPEALPQGAGSLFSVASSGLQMGTATMLQAVIADFDHTYCIASRPLMNKGLTPFHEPSYTATHFGGKPSTLLINRSLCR